MKAYLNKLEIYIEACSVLSLPVLDSIPNHLIGWSSLEFISVIIFYENPSAVDGYRCPTLPFAGFVAEIYRSCISIV